MSRQRIEQLDDVLAPEITHTTGGYRRRRYHPGHIARIASQRARAQAERDALRGPQ